MLALIPIRDGTLPSGAAETAAECAGRVLAVGSDVLAGEGRAAVARLGADVRAAELGPYAPGEWARRLVPLLADEPLVVLPASPDGRDLAPRLAHLLDRPLHAGAVEVVGSRVTLTRGAGHELHTWTVDGPAIATFQPGGRAANPPERPTDVVDATPALAPPPGDAEGADVADATVVVVDPPDVTTMDLGEADRILGGGAGLDQAGRFEQLARVAARLGAAMGATRVVTDRGWVGHARQIGTTGVVVDPRLYLAFGVSGAVQHTSGLGQPDRVISVNLDPHCPMMQMADLAVVADANATLDALEALL